MICDRCGAYADSAGRVCDKCGTLLARRKTSAEGIAAMRQGRVSVQAQKVQSTANDGEVKIFGQFDPSNPIPPNQAEKLKSNRSAHTRKQRSYERDAGRPGMRRGVPTVTGSMNTLPLQKHLKTINPISRHSINWSKVLVSCLAALVLAFAGIYMYITQTLSGQVILARHNKANEAQAYWIVAEEHLNQGYIADAIAAFEKARELDSAKTPPVNNIDGLLLLGAAYEAGDRLNDAETLYTYLTSKEVASSRPEPYRNLIRIMLERGEDREAGALMLVAFQNTNILSFRQQRTDLLPKEPETNWPAGRYAEFKSVVFSSPQGYDVYYTLNAELDFTEESDEWELYTEPITLGEGVVSYKVVCVSGRLVSDPMTCQYIVYLPSPAAPKAGLAPNTYTSRKRVYLRPGDEDKSVRIYYTLDGSDPDINDSPLYTDEGIRLPTGKVTLKAIAVNSYNKPSNAMEVGYMFEVKPYPEKVYDRSDTFGEFELMKTELTAFEEVYGKGLSETEEIRRGFEEPCKRITYDWGSIVAGKDRSKKTWLIIEVDMSKELATLPRKIRFGQTSEDVIAKFRDGTQPPGASGNRGLYFSDSGIGKYYKLSDTTAKVQYTCLYTDGNILALELYFDNNILTRFKHWYVYD